jgi:hypothetical protein
MYMSNGSQGGAIAIREVAFRRKFNLGNYESLDVELVATVGEGQEPQEVLTALDAETRKYRKNREEK